MPQDIHSKFLELRKIYIEKQFLRLNEIQQNAVFTTKGPLLILAGAGSGKTTVLVNRVANMVRFGNAYFEDTTRFEVTNEDCTQLQNIIKNGESPSERLEAQLSVYAVRPYNILAITFTNKAAGELKSRLSSMLPNGLGEDVNASTFHSACVRILRKYADKLSFPTSFTIYDSDDQQRAVKEVFKLLNIDDKFISVKSALSSIGRLKDKMISPKDALSAPSDSKDGLIARIYEAYANRLKSAGALDFDDLIYYTVYLFENHPDALEYYQNRYKYIMVDEYQDTSVAQFKLVYLLASKHNNVCVVGDDDQSIYKFRGATIENILNFESHYPGAKVIRLEENYRSTSNILNAANCVIKNNLGRKGKTLWTKSGEGEKILYYEANDESDEASHVATVIGENLKKGAKLKDHAILYRMNAQSGPVETYFARAGIPYRIFGGQRFFSRKEIKDMLSYMSIVVNRKDSERLRRIINEPSRKIGLATLDNIAKIAQKQNCDMLDVIENAPKYPELSRALSALKNFNSIYKKLVENYNTMPLDAFAASILSVTGYDKMLDAEGETGQTRLENIGQLVSGVKIYADQRGAQATLEGYLEEVALISDIDNYDEESDVVVLMTMHAAKGLEFPFVFILGLEEGIFPGEMSRYNEEDLEEERRLAYVGITRAKKELYLSSASSRFMFGQTKRNRVSRFLEEIDGDLLDVKEKSFTGSFRQGYGVQKPTGSVYSGNFTNSKPPTKTTAVGSFKGFSSSSTVKNSVTQNSVNEPKHVYQKGDKVEHKVFGKGIVNKVTPVAGDTIVEISFERVGVKKTMANYAPLTLIE